MPSTGTLELPVTADTMLASGGLANTAYGSQEFLSVGNLRVLGNDVIQRGLVRISDVATTLAAAQPASLISAILRFKRTNGTLPSPADFTFNSLTADWVESEATWNNRTTGNAWTTVGGDFNPLGTITTTGVPTSGALFDVNLLTLVAAEPASINGILRGPEAPGASTYINLASREDTDAADRPRVIVTYRTLPIIERIARKLAGRLATVTTGGGYTHDFRVTRPTIGGVSDAAHGAVILTQAPDAVRDDRNSVQAGAISATAWQQTFQATILFAGTDPLEQLANIAAAEAESAIALDGDSDWAQFDGLALDCWQSGRMIEAAGKFFRVVISFTVLYRTPDNDPYAVA